MHAWRSTAAGETPARLPACRAQQPGGRAYLPPCGLAGPCRALPCCYPCCAPPRCWRGAYASACLASMLHDRIYKAVHELQQL